jgi:hypothetical protein
MNLIIGQGRPNVSVRRNRFVVGWGISDACGPSLTIWAMPYVIWMILLAPSNCITRPRRFAATPMILTVCS